MQLCNPYSCTPLLLCSGSKAIHEYTAFDWAALFLPCLTWLRTYKIKEYLMVRDGMQLGTSQAGAS